MDLKLNKQFMFKQTNIQAQARIYTPLEEFCFLYHHNNLSNLLLFFINKYVLTGVKTTTAYWDPP